MIAPLAATTSIRISDFMDSPNLGDEYSFIETAQYLEWERLGIDPEEITTLPSPDILPPPIVTVSSTDCQELFNQF